MIFSKACCWCNNPFTVKKERKFEMFQESNKKGSMEFLTLSWCISFLGMFLLTMYVHCRISASASSSGCFICVKSG